MSSRPVDMDHDEAPPDPAQDDEDEIILEAPSGAALDMDFNSGAQSAEADNDAIKRCRDCSMLLLQLALDERQSDSSTFRSTAVLDNSSTLLLALADSRAVAPTKEFLAIKHRAERRRYPRPIEAYITFLMSPATAGTQIARTAVGVIAILIMSSEDLPATIDADIKSKVRSCLHFHLRRCREGPNKCESISIHVSQAFSYMVLQDWWPTRAASPSLHTQLFKCGPSNCKDLDHCSPWLHRMCSSTHTFHGGISARLLLAAGLGAELLTADLEGDLQEDAGGVGDDGDAMEVDDDQSSRPEDDAAAGEAEAPPGHGLSQPSNTLSPPTCGPNATVLLRIPARLPIPRPEDLFAPRPYLRQAFATLPTFPREATLITWRQATKYFSEYIIKNKDRFFINNDVVHAHIAGSPLAKAFNNDVLHRADATQSLLRQLIPASSTSTLDVPIEAATRPSDGPLPAAAGQEDGDLPAAQQQEGGHLGHQADEGLPDGDTRQEICCACQDHLPPHARCTLACNHTLHLDCATRWFQESSTCPLCRDVCSTTNMGLLPVEALQRTMIFPSGAALTSSPRHLNLSAIALNVRATRPSAATPAPLLAPSSPTSASSAAVVNPGSEATQQGMEGTRYQHHANRGGSFHGLLARRVRLLERAQERQRPYPLPAPNNPPQRPSALQTVRDVHFLQTTIQVLMTVIAFTLASFLPSSRGALIENSSPPKHVDPSLVSIYRSNDILAFESFPRSVSMGLTSETVNLSVLFELQSTLETLEAHASDLRGSTQVPLSQAEAFCSPSGYHQQLTDVLSPSLKLPHFIEAKELDDEPAKTYVAILRGHQGSLYCNYSLSHQAIMTLTSTLDRSSSYYNQNRRQKFDSYSTWLHNSKGENCQTGRTLRRGEIIPDHADMKLHVSVVSGSMYSCAEACKNMARLYETNQQGGCMWGSSCAGEYTKDCRFYSFNWQTGICSLSSRLDVSLDTGWTEGFNSLTAPVDCLALAQHQPAYIDLNGTMTDMAGVCKFNHKGNSPSAIVYRSCPGDGNGMMNDLLPLKTLLESYTMALSRDQGLVNVSSPKLDKRKAINGLEGITATDNLVELERKKRSSPAVLAFLKPVLRKFIELGRLHLSSSIGMQFVSGALPLGYLLLLGSSLIALTVDAATESYATTSATPFVHLSDSPMQTFEAWDLVESPNLLSLEPRDKTCRVPANILEASNQVPSILHAMHRSLNRLQQPLRRLVEDPTPISNKVRSTISDAGGRFGFWTVYDEKRKTMTRYYTYRISGDPKTAVRQVAIIGGSSLSPVKQGTLVQGGIPPPSAPSWTCAAVVSEATESSPSYTPKECYGSPQLTTSPMFMTSFLPHSDIIRIIGRHFLDYDCPQSSPGSIYSRGILIFIIGRECSLSLDGAVTRDPDIHGESSWSQPLILVDRTSEFQPHNQAPFPPPLKYAVGRLANKTLSTTISQLAESTANINNRSDSADIAIGLFFATVLVLGGAALLIYRHRQKCFEIWQNWRNRGNQVESEGDQLHERSTTQGRPGAPNPPSQGRFPS